MILKCRDNKVKLAFLSVSLFFIFLLPLFAYADIVGGNAITGRYTRDGIVNATYIDMKNTIQSDSVLTGWNIWAQSYAFTWPYSTAARSVKLIIFRTNNSNFDIVGTSELETVAEWDRDYHFDLATPIPVKAGDLIGWYNPVADIPGGVISFEWDYTASNLVRWAYDTEVTGSVSQSIFYPGESRIYSINVEGSAVPIPAAGWLFASGLAGFIGLKRRSFFKG